MTRDQIIALRAQLNLQEYMQYGPGLRKSTRTWVIAKDTIRGMVYLGGLGAMGSGEMWVEFGRHVNDPTFAGAPEHGYQNDPFKFD